MSEYPSPLVPADVDLRDFPRMPFEIARLRRSKAWLIAKKTPELGFYMVNLWMASWHDAPAGSLEDDDEVLCDLAMCNPTRWPKVREQVMRNWTKCSDGRLYHETVAQMVLLAWESKQAQRKRTAAATAAKKAKAAAGNASSDPRDEPPEGGDDQRDEHRDDDRNDERDDQRNGIATSTKRREEKGEGRDKSPPPPRGEGRFPEFWSAWPNTDRKADRKKCVAKWQRCGFDAEADEILRHVAESKLSRKWAEGFEPAPLTYLNGERWKDGVPIEGMSQVDSIFDGVH